MTPPRSRTAHRSVALLGALLLPLGLAACTGSETDDDVEDTTARPASVALGATAASGEAAAEPLSATLGVVVTLRSRRGEGSDQRFGAAGAQLAAYRMSLGEAEVDLEVVDDDGTTAGARDAVASLVEAGVAGIVVASQGEHLSEALADAADAGVPVLLPYDRRDTLPDGVWQTGPSASAVDAALLEALRADGHESPYVVTADGLEVDGVGSADGATYRPGRAGQVVRRALDALDTGSADAVVVAGSASTQADLVARFAGVGADTAVPLYLSPEALSPAFPRALVDEADALVGGLVSVGVDASDATTLQRGEQGDGAAAFFAALRLADQDPDLTGLLGSGDFAAGDADTASHDAVVALVRAVETAGSAEPDAVAAALEGLTLDTSDGLVGAALDFSRDRALADDAVVTLVATTQDPGVRPGGADAPRLFWFAVEESPTAGE